MHPLKADTFRLFGRAGWRLTARAMVSNQAFRVVAALRLCQAAHRRSFRGSGLALFPARVLHLAASVVSGIEIPWRTAIQPGLALVHGRGIVVNVNASIGKNVTLFHGVTLGQRDSIASDGSRQTRYPVIEDDVWIGPYATVAGVRVGKGSRIAAGACVFEDVPPHSIVLGNPGRVVKTGCMPDVVHRWED